MKQENYGKRGILFILFELILGLFKKTHGVNKDYKSIEDIENAYESDSVLSSPPPVPKKQTPAQKNAVKEWRRFPHYKYEDDKYYPAGMAANRDRPVTSMFTIHYAYTRTLMALTSYFQRGTVAEKRYANSTWGMDNDTGETHAYLRKDQVIWTNGNGQFIDHTGRWRKDTNNFSTSVEIAQLGNRPYGEACYRALAERMHWMLREYPEYRIWFTTGHEHIDPMIRNDPGPHFDWRKLFVEHVGIRPDFYEAYLSYLDANKNNTIGNQANSDLKFGRIKHAVSLIQTDLIGKPQDYCF
jgi:N-acetyl-anhydromuramyl-L-alanine amidase AmpD